jgi:hypothetical protein
MWSGSSSRTGTSGGAAAAASRSGAGLSQGKLLEAAAAAAAAKSGESSAAAAAAAAASVGAGVSSGGGLPAELPPVGCAPDAYKLFIGNIPKSYTEEELRPVSALGCMHDLSIACEYPVSLFVCLCAGFLCHHEVSGRLPAELPPFGCSPDAYKLFIGNIPKSYTEKELRPVSASQGILICVLHVDATFSDWCLCAGSFVITRCLVSCLLSCRLLGVLRMRTNCLSATFEKATQKKSCGR